MGQSSVGVERVKLKYPYLASEIINCQIPLILDNILNNKIFLDLLFDFIFCAPPLNAVLTNYWRSCVVGLVRRNSQIVLEYIQNRDNLLSSLVSHIRDQSIMELVIALGWDPAIEELKELDQVADWMYSQQLIPKLINSLSPNKNDDEHSAASYTLVDIVAKTSRSTNLVLFHCLASKESIDALMNHMFAGNRSSLLESLSVLLALLHHYPNVSAEGNISHNPLAPHSAQSTIPAVVQAVCQRLDQFKILLLQKPPNKLKLPFIELSPPLGPVRHKVVDMIVALMRTPSVIVSKKLKELGLIKICIDLFFAYPWNNLLHGSVEHIIQMVVSGDCEILKKALFEDCDFLNRILSARQLSAKHQEDKKFRLGYMGHITRVSNTIVEFAKRNVQLEGYMEANQKWIKFIGDDLKLENEQLNTQLGGHRPTTLDNDCDGDDFTLFTLNDINTTNNSFEEEVDEDSDSEEEEEEDIKTPQDAFNQLTKKLDEEKNKKSDEFDEWFNDEENWNDFDSEQEKKEQQQQQSQPNESEQKQPTQTQQSEQTEINDFDNWDNPFSDDPIFEEQNGHNIDDKITENVENDDDDEQIIDDATQNEKKNNQ